MTRRPHALRHTLRPALLALLISVTGTVSTMFTAQQATAASAAKAPARTAATPPASANHCSSAPAGLAFHGPPPRLPPGAHGDIIWCRPVASPAPGANAWQILYLSTTVSGARTAVSGTVLVPTAPYPGTRPVVAYGSGTQGWGDQCAPSREMASGNY